MTDYGQEIIVLAREYNELTGKYVFAGVENRSATNKLWMFDTGNLRSGAEALGYMRERLAAAQAGQPEPCIARPGEPCLHTPEHTAHRVWAAYGSREAAESEKPVQAQLHPVHAQHVAEIERLSAEFAELGAESPFRKYDGHYWFTDAMMASAPHALAHMRGLLAQAQREHSVTVLGPAAEVRHDGKTEARFPGEDTTRNANDAWTYILKHQAQSVDWAMRYEGWAIVEIAPDGTETTQPAS